MRFGASLFLSIVMFCLSQPLVGLAQAPTPTTPPTVQIVIKNPEHNLLRGHIENWLRRAGYRPLHEGLPGDYTCEVLGLEGGYVGGGGGWATPFGVFFAQKAYWWIRPQVGLYDPEGASIYNSANQELGMGADYWAKYLGLPILATCKYGFDTGSAQRAMANFFERLPNPPAPQPRPVVSPTAAPPDPSLRAEVKNGRQLYVFAPAGTAYWVRYTSRAGESRRLTLILKGQPDHHWNNTGGDLWVEIGRVGDPKVVWSGWLKPGPEF